MFAETLAASASMEAALPMALVLMASLCLFYFNLLYLFGYFKLLELILIFCLVVLTIDEPPERVHNHV